MNRAFVRRSGIHNQCGAMRQPRGSVREAAPSPLRAAWTLKPLVKTYRRRPYPRRHQYPYGAGAGGIWQLASGTQLP